MKISQFVDIAKRAMRKIYTNKFIHKMKSLNLSFYLKSLKKKKQNIPTYAEERNKNMNDINELKKRKINETKG